MSINLKKFKARNFNFVVIAVVNSIIKTASERKILLTHKRTIQRGLVRIAKRKLTMYTNSSCPCPALQANQTYLIMGFEDILAGKLLVGPQSFVYVWPRKWKKEKKYKQIRRSLRAPLRNLLRTLEQEHKRKLKKRAKYNLTKNKRKGNST